MLKELGQGEKMVSKNSMIRLAQSSPYKNWMHGCFVFRGGSVVAAESNTKNQHAECRAINKVKNKKNLTVLSIRVNNDGQLRMARPCDECRRFLLHHGVKSVLYSTDDGRIIKDD